jgi:hypothetical protein
MLLAYRQQHFLLRYKLFSFAAEVRNLASARGEEVHTEPGCLRKQAVLP